MKVGYIAGVWDLFHIGHVTILRNCKEMCDKLIVAVTTDEFMIGYKNKNAVIPFTERCEVVRSCKYVDVVVSQPDMDKFAAWEKMKFDIMFVGDDWFKSDKWNKIEKKLNKVGVKVIYFPYTQGTSSTLINETLSKLRGEKK